MEWHLALLAKVPNFKERMVLAEVLPLNPSPPLPFLFEVIIQGEEGVLLRNCELEMDLLAAFAAELPALLAERFSLILLLADLTSHIVWILDPAC